MLTTSIILHRHQINATSGDTTKKLIVSSDTDGATAITNYEYEQTLNDNKRQIRLLDRNYIQQFTRDFERLIKRKGNNGEFTICR